MPPSASIIPRRRRVIVYSWPVLCVGHCIPTVVIIICEILLFITRLHQLILNLLMKTVNPCIIAINRSRSNIIRLLVSSILQNLNRRFNLVSGAHQSSIIVIAHHLRLLGLSLHIVRLRGGASVRASSHYVWIEFPLWVGACCHFVTINLRRRRVCIHRHLDTTRVKISRCLVHEILSHRNGGAPCGAHQRLLLLGINRLLPWGLSVLKDLLLLLKHHPNIWLLLLLFSFLKF
jgi:hypothetical protein